MTLKIKSIPYVLILSVSLMVYSCSLNESPTSQIEEEKIFTSGEALYQHAVASLYGYVGGNSDGQGLQGTCRGVYDLQTFGSDEAIIPTRGVDWFDSGMWQQLYFHNWSAGHEVIKNSWLYLYKVIALCNRSLETLEKYKYLLSGFEYDRYAAEVRSLRAIYYWYLLDLFGNVPIVTQTDVSMNEVTQNTRLDVFEFVRDELTKNMPYLVNQFSGSVGVNYGRVTQAVACFVLAKLYLNAEVYGAAPTYDKALHYCEMIGEMQYKLEPDYINCFAVNNEGSVENIWIIPMDRVLYTNLQQNMIRSMHWRHADACGYLGENGSSATLTVLRVNHFEEPDEDKRFSRNYWGRMAFDYNSRLVSDRNGENLRYYPWEIKYDMKGSEHLETAGARMFKYELDRNSNGKGSLVDNDIVLFRYADVLLMQAEAKVRLGQSGQAELDRIRERAKMPSRPATLDNIYDERLIELAWEGWRRNDMIRFGKYQSEALPNARVDESDGHTCLFPIPQYALDTNPNLKQNPGY